MSIVEVSPKRPIEPSYLGDGVYAEFDGYMIELYISNGMEKSPSIFLEPAVYLALRAYGARIWDIAP